MSSLRSGRASSPPQVENWRRAGLGCTLAPGWHQPSLVIKLVYFSCSTFIHFVHLTHAWATMQMCLNRE